MIQFQVFWIEWHCRVELFLFGYEKKTWLDNAALSGRCLTFLEHFTPFIALTRPADFLQWKYYFFRELFRFVQFSIKSTFVFPVLSPTAKKDTLVENKPLIYQLGEAKGSPEKAGQCCHFQSDWHWAVSLHSTVHDSALVANTGSSVTAAVQSKIAWKHEWMIDLIHKKCDV